MIWLRLGFLFAAFGSGFWFGSDWQDARNAREAARVKAEQEARTEALARELASQAMEIATFRSDQTLIAMEIENEVRADADLCRVPSERSLQRLRGRWGAATTP